MNKLFSMVAILAVCTPAIAAAPMGRGRAGVNAGASMRASASKNQLANVAAINDEQEVETVAAVTHEIMPVVEDTTVETPEQPEEPAVPEKDMREKERAACIQNNIGVGATFVWASKYSNTENYSSMVEDVDNPENNVCFVKVGLKSNDTRIDVSDVPTKYFTMGETVTCGSWADAEGLRKRILDAKKKGRTWATVGGAVGGAGIGVGAMELFGNKLIGGKVMGQKALEGTELLCSQMKVLAKDDPTQYEQVKSSLRELKDYCEKTEWTTSNPKPEVCDPKPELIKEMKAFEFDKLLAC